MCLGNCKEVFEAMSTAYERQKTTPQGQLTYTESVARILSSSQGLSWACRRVNSTIGGDDGSWETSDFLFVSGYPRVCLTDVAPHFLSTCISTASSAKILTGSRLIVSDRLSSLRSKAQSNWPRESDLPVRQALSYSHSELNWPDKHHCKL